MNDAEPFTGRSGMDATRGGSALGQVLLTAARRERPTPELQLRMAHALGLPASVAVPVGVEPFSSTGTGTGTGTAAGTAATSLSMSASTLALLSVGVLASLVAAGLGVRAAVDRSSRRSSAAERPTPVALSAPGGAGTPAVPSPLAVAAPKPAAPPLAAASETAVADEVQALDLARTALNERAPSRALEHLDHYAQRHPRGALGPEAAVLRIEALTQGGGRAQAGALARQFFARYPDSPLRPRVERLIAAVSR